MNANQMISMVVRMVMRQVMRRGVNAGIDAVANRKAKSRAGDDDHQNAKQAPGAGKTQQRMRQSMRALRRMGRF